MTQVSLTQTNNNKMLIQNCHVFLFSWESSDYSVQSQNRCIGSKTGFIQLLDNVTARGEVVSTCTYSYIIEDRLFTSGVRLENKRSKGEV